MVCHREMTYFWSNILCWKQDKQECTNYSAWNVPNESTFLYNLRSLNPFLKSEMPKNGQFFHKSREKCARSAFLGIFGASAQLHGGTQIFYFTANPSLAILFQRWEVENQFKIMFFPYFGLNFTICHIPVIIGNRDISKL